MFDFIIAGYRWIFLQMASVLGPGWAIVALSFICSALMAPLMKAVSSIVRRETEYQSVINPQLDAIKASYASDMERHLHIQRLYSRYSYSPISAVKKVFPLFVQIPFLLLTFFMLKGTSELSGVQFLFLKDMGAADGLAGGVNLLPFVMTAVNLLTVFAAQDFSIRDRVHAIGISVLFLVMLYAAPSALLLFWTLNNAITLFKTLLHNGGGGVIRLISVCEYGFELFVLFTRRRFAIYWFFIFTLFSCYFFITAYTVGQVSEKFTYDVTFRGMIFLVMVASVFETLYFLKGKFLQKFFASFCLLVSLSVSLGLIVMVLFFRSMFVTVLRPEYVYRSFGLLFALLVIPFLPYRKFHFVQFCNCFVKVVQSVSPWLLLAGALAIHYSHSSNFVSLSPLSVVSLSAYMILPLIGIAFLCAVVLDDAIDLDFVAHAVVATGVSIYVMPMIVSSEVPFLSYERNVIVRILLILTMIVLSVVKNWRAVGNVFLFILSIALVGGAVLTSKSKCAYSDESPEVPHDLFKELHCIRTNNVFFCVYDSYLNRTLQRCLGLDDLSKEDELRALGFTIYDAYSVGWATLPSMGATFTVGGVAGSSPRAMMAGDNAYSDFLKGEGYRTSYILTSFDMPNKGERMPGDYYYPGASRVIRPENVLFPCIIRGSLTQSPLAFDVYSHEEWIQAKRTEFAGVGKSENFIYAHSAYPGHAFWAPCYRKSDDEEQKNYRNRLMLANKEMMEDAQLLVSRNDDSIVIFAGDHGAFLLSPHSSGEVDERHLLDRHGIMLAIRWPSDYRPTLRLNCLQNVLLEVMIYLTGNKTLARYESEGKTYAMPYPLCTKEGLIRSGEIQFGPRKGIDLFQVVCEMFKKSL